MTKRYAIAAGSAVALLCLLALAILAVWGPGLPDGLETSASSAFERRTGHPAEVARAGTWSDCAVVDMTGREAIDYPSMIMIQRDGDGWHLARVAGKTGSDYFDTDDVASRDACLSVANGTYR